jgi:hypothetical protein
MRRCLIAFVRCQVGSVGRGLAREPRHKRVLVVTPIWTAKAHVVFAAVAARIAVKWHKRISIRFKYGLVPNDFAAAVRHVVIVAADLMDWRDLNIGLDCAVKPCTTPVNHMHKHGGVAGEHANNWLLRARRTTSAWHLMFAAATSKFRKASLYSATPA